ncbi:MAG TPA: hypothetical protein PKI80_03745 [Deltaproteobacteria bacterium]|nr:hypothetical protein [Deltaproteobacteria bacterium]
MNERLASILDSIRRHDPLVVDEFNKHFSELREEARDRYESGATPEGREAARWEAVAYRKILGMFEDARKIMEARRARENAARDNASAGLAPRRGGIHTL